jgi:hypothetical protein
VRHISSGSVGDGSVVDISAGIASVEIGSAAAVSAGKTAGLQQAASMENSMAKTSSSDTSFPIIVPPLLNDERGLSIDIIIARKNRKERKINKKAAR